MAIFSEDGPEQFDLALPVSFTESTSASVPVSVRIIGSKLQTPSPPHLFGRPWLIGILERSATNSAATMLVGRAGSGKTAIAADFVARIADHSWYSIDPSDADWISFQRYFRSALAKTNGKNIAIREETRETTESPAELFAELSLPRAMWPKVLVLDGIHHLYDCEWFADFFSRLISSVPHSSHVLLIGRSEPPAPVWRMRSKQVLNVIDEKLLAFSKAETREFLGSHGISRDEATRIHSETFGRACDVMSYVKTSTAL